MFKVFAAKNPFGRRKSMKKKITLGICAMDKKARSKPMTEILKRLPEELFEIIIFGDECILNNPVDQWPVVEALIAFYSTRFPTQKALEYVALRKPYMINDLEMDAVLKDRRKVYELLMSQGIDVPFHVFCNRDDPNVENIVEEYDEYIIVNGVQINKPLVEKPIDAEDHNIYIYYPVSAGGGSKRLFRKLDDRSSEFYPKVNELRREGSYIYEQFVITQGTDVKVYTVGPEYGHAEARKSPVVDGRVNRDSAGLEVRYPVILSPLEKDIARKIVTAFKQTVCGFDILRVQHKPYCCDVNGFSFVKNSRKYYDDASQILTELMLTTLRPDYDSNYTTRQMMVTKDRLSGMGTKLLTPIPPQTSTPKLSDRPPSPTMSQQSVDDGASTFTRLSSDELRCVIAVFRHGDRTPKQKMKIKVTLQKYLDYFHTYANNSRKELKVKSKSALLKFLEITREIIEGDDTTKIDLELKRKLRQIRDVLERWEISGINRKLQMKPEKWTDETIPGDTSSCKATELLLILKWGGDLTPLGREQAESVGATFRHTMYPDHEGGGVLRLHATYRHDLKIKASDEGRVMKTAAAFTKGLLELEGQLTPILASLVTVEEKNRQLLDKGGNNEIKEDMDRCKDHLNLLQKNDHMSDEIVEQIAPGCSAAIKNALLNLNNPLQTLRRIHVLIGQLCAQLHVLCREHGEEVGVDEIQPSESLDVSYNDSEVTASRSNSFYSITPNTSVVNDTNVDGLYLSETLSLMADRWEKLFKDFYSAKAGQYDLTKVPDVYDMVRFDILHNSHLELTGIKELYHLAAAFENAVVPQEYGTDRNDKRRIGSKMCGALLEKIKNDLNASHRDELHFQLDHSHAADLAINTLERSVRTRLYFTSESHLHTLLNVLRFPHNGQPCAFDTEGLEKLDQVSELSYLTQVIIRLFENKENENMFRCEISFTPGASNDPFGDNRNELAPYVLLNKSISCDDMITCLDNAIQAGKEEIAEKSDSLDTMDTSDLIDPLSPPSLKRIQSICVVSSSHGITDRWERGSSGSDTKKPKQKQKDPLGVPLANRFSI